MVTRLLSLLLLSCLVSCTETPLPTTPPEGTFWRWKSPYGTFNIRYIEKGSGPRHVILLHGLGAQIYSWRYLIDPLVEAGYHVWAMDRIGFGWSDKPENVPYGLDLFLSEVTTFMKEKEIPKAQFIGNSLGGGIALATAVTHPDKVESLTLIDALGYPLDFPLPLAILKATGQASVPFLGRTSTKKVLERIVYDPTKITQEQLDAYTFPLLMSGGKNALIATVQSYDEKQLLDLSRQYSKITVPVLLIWGEKDTFIPLSHFYHFKRDFPQARTKVIPNCGHIPQEECPSEVINTVLEFLKHQQTIAN